MYKFFIILTIFFTISCNLSCGILSIHARRTKKENWEKNKRNINEALSAKEYCVYCMGGGSQAAIVRLKQASYKLDRESHIALTAQDKMRSIISTWTRDVGLDVANFKFSKWYGYFIDETSPYRLAIRVVNDVVEGTLSPSALEEVHIDLPKYGKELYRINFQQRKLLELVQDIDTYAVPPHGACGICVRMEEQRKFSEMQNQMNFYR